MKGDGGTYQESHFDGLDLQGMISGSQGEGWRSKGPRDEAGCNVGYSRWNEMDGNPFFD